MKLGPNNEDIDLKTGVKLSDIDEHIKNIKIIELDKTYLQELLPGLADDENFDVFAFFLVQIKSVRRLSGTEAMAIGGDDTYNKNLIFKIPENTKISLDLIISNLELDIDDSERNQIKSILPEGEERTLKTTKLESTNNLVTKLILKNAMNQKEYT